MRDRVEDGAPEDEDNGSAFGQLLGAFGSHANIERRHKAERLAAIKPIQNARRKKSARPHQFNVRVSDRTQAFAKALCEKRDWSQADLIEAAIAALAKSEKIKGAEDA